MAAADSLATGLTNEQRIQEFAAITCCDDLDFCADCLERNNWSVERAVNDFFSRPSRTPKPTTSTTDESWFEYFREVTRSSIGEDSLVGGYFALPLIDLSEFFIDGVWFITSLIGNFIFPASNVSNNSSDLNQLLSDQSPITAISHNSQNQLPPWFLTGSLQEAVAESRIQSKLLFLVIHEDGNLSRQYFQQTIQNDAVMSFLIHNLVCWATRNNSRDGRALLRQMRNSNRIYPISSLYRVRDQDLQLLWKYDGFIDADALVAFLMQGLERVQYAEEQVQASNLRAVQDAEYEELEQQFLQEQQRREMENEITPVDIEPEVSEPVEDPEEELLKAREETRVEFGALVPDEPGENTDRIEFRFRLPDGTNNSRYFLPSHKVLDLKNFVSSLDLRSTSDDVVEVFELFTPFPRKVYTKEEETIEKAFGAAKRVNLVVKEVI